MEFVIKIEAEAYEKFDRTILDSQMKETSTGRSSDFEVERGIKMVIGHIV